MVTIVVDDLNVSFEALARLRDALHQYIDTRLAPGDRVAILRTGGDVSVMQQFTSGIRRMALDRRCHLAALQVRHAGR
jgi:hypothetical protein